MVLILRCLRPGRIIVRILATMSAEEIGIRYTNNPPPNGFGFAVRRGLTEFRGEAVAIGRRDRFLPEV